MSLLGKQSGPKLFVRLSKVSVLEHVRLRQVLLYKIPSDRIPGLWALIEFTKVHVNIFGFFSLFKCSLINLRIKNWIFSSYNWKNSVCTKHAKITLTLSWFRSLRHFDLNFISAGKVGTRNSKTTWRYLDIRNVITMSWITKSVAATRSRSSFWV